MTARLVYYLLTWMIVAILILVALQGRIGNLLANCNGEIRLEKCFPCILGVCKISFWSTLKPSLPTDSLPETIEVDKF